MKYSELLSVINDMGLGERKEIYSENNDKVIIFRPEKLGRSLKNKNYDVKKNFQIILKKPNEKEFLPNHLRVMIEVNHRITKDEANADRFLEIIEEIYNGEDPLKFKDEVSKWQIEGEFDSPIINICLIQLFMSEQDVNYTHGKIQPPRAYLMGWLRFIKTKEQNIDKVLWSSIRHAPRQAFWKTWNQSENNPQKQDQK